jgi:hypothetical protein
MCANQWKKRRVMSDNKCKKKIRQMCANSEREGGQCVPINGRR